MIMRSFGKPLLNLGDEFVVCEEAGTAAEGLKQVREMRPDAVIVDVGLSRRYQWDRANKEIAESVSRCRRAHSLELQRAKSGWIVTARSLDRDPIID
jgi:DNA-binding NarL/FixJ family response regulator